LKANLTSLLDLQKIDQKIQALEALRGDLPQQVEALKSELEGRESRLKEVEEQLAEATKNKFRLDNELQAQQERRETCRERLYAVTSNREYDAITVEIDTISESISETEDQILELLESQESLTSETLELQEAISDLKEELSSREEELKTKIAATEQEFGACASKRDNLIGAIRQSVLYQYERIRKGLGNSAVAVVHNSACGECFSAIPPQKCVEIRMMNELILCESCGRILVFCETNETVTG